METGIDEQFLANEDNWPNWPLQTMERRVNKWDKDGLGVIASGKTTRIYLTNLFALGTGFLRDILKDVPYVDYDSVNEMLQEWKVD